MARLPPILTSVPGNSRLVLSAAALAAAALLYFVPPESSRFYPRCLFHDATGLLCPGCGATRALAAMLHGHLVLALHFNALVIMFLPVALLYLARALRRASWPRIPVPMMAALLAVASLFTVYRNLP